jgi:hypothetical protein
LLTHSFTQGADPFLRNRSIQFIPTHPLSLRCILILSIHLQRGLPSGLSPSDFPTNILMHSFLPNSCYMSCPSHPPRLAHSNYTWRRVQVMKLLIIQLSQPSRHLLSKFPTVYGTLRFFRANKNSQFFCIVCTPT